MATTYGGSYFGMATPAVKPKKPPTYGTSNKLATQLASGQGSRTAFANPYDANDQAHFGSTAGGYGPLTTPDYPTYTPPAPLGTPSQYSAPNIQAPSAPAGMSFDLNSDPVLQQMKAMAANQRAQAESGALKLRKQLAIDYGDQAYGSSIDEATGQAAAANPFSILANLKTGYERSNTNMEEALNAHNLFYGGARIKSLADALHDYQGQQYGAGRAEQGSLEGINQNRIAALMQADQAEQAAYADAYNRALQLALAAGSGGGGGGGGYDPTWGGNQPGQVLGGTIPQFPQMPGMGDYSGGGPLPAQPKPKPRYSGSYFGTAY